MKADNQGSVVIGWRRASRSDTFAKPEESR
jgi:hypothetical protein